jgi:putative flippase GtrA
MAMPFVSQKLGSAVVDRLPEPVRRRVGSPTGRRMIRFAPAAVVALAATQITYFMCVSVVHTSGRVSGFSGWLAGAVVSYGVSRWAWERRGRPRLLAETVPFVVISLVVGAVLVEASHFGYQEAGGLGLRGIAFYAFAQGFYLAANAVTFIVRFVIFNFVVFADRRISLGDRSGRVRRLLPELVRFGLVGALALLVSGGVTIALNVQAGVGLPASGVAGAVVGAAVSYAGNRYWTFRHRQRASVAREGIRYLVLSGAGLAIQVASLWFATGLLGLHSRLAVSAALVVGVALGASFRYWSCRSWVWQAQRVASPVVA